MHGGIDDSRRFEKGRKKNPGPKREQAFSKHQTVYMAMYTFAIT